MNLARLFFKIVERKADDMAVVFHQKTIDYWMLGKRAKGFASFLKDAGALPGTKVAIVLGNVPEFIAGLFGCWQAGCVVVPVNPFYKAREIAYILDKAEASFVLSQRGNEEVKKAVESRHHIEVKALDAAMSDLPMYSGEVCEEHEDALIIFTNAEDGFPKGAVLTHENIYHNLQSCYEASKTLGEEEVVLGALPFFHAFGLTGCLLYALLQGAKCVLVPKFTPDAILRIMEETPVTFFTGVPTMFASLCMGREPSRAFARTRLLVSGGAPLTQEIYGRFLELYDKPILQGYGLTEASPVVSLNPLDGSHKVESIGKPLPGVEVEVKSGELVVRGKNVMKGYYKDEKATQKVLQPDGLHTGDLAEIDKDGFIFLKGLKKRMLLMGGFNVYFKEVENVLLLHPQIQRAEVFPEEDFLFYQVPAANIEVRGTISEREVLQHCKRYLANYKVPRKLYIQET